MNPFPAVTTSPFLATVGSDYSANDQFSAISLTPASFSSASIVFDPTTVNTTGKMIITIKTTNRLPLGSYFQIKFPTNLAWNEDVSGSTRKLPIENITNCTRVTNNLNTGIICNGQSSNQIITISNLSNV